MVRRFGFGRKERLKSRKAIESLFTSGKSLSQFPLRVMYQFHPVKAETDSGVQAGVTASKRHFKKAVDRNRIKRLLRESYRLQKEILAPAVKAKRLKVHLFFMYMDKTIPDQETTHAAMLRCLKQLEKAIQKHESPS